MNPPTSTAAPDVVVIGGGAIGCAAAVALLRRDPGITVCVLEPDPTYREAATPRASGGVRQLFTQPENVALSRYTIEVIESWDSFVVTDVPPLGWTPNGYLFVSTPGQEANLRANLVTQVSGGVDANWMTPGQLAAAFPQLATHDLSGGVWSPTDGWLDPSALLTGLRRTAIALGAVFVRTRVCTLSVVGSRINRLELEVGNPMTPGAVINAAGVWAPELAASVGMPVPVEPMRRLEHVVQVRGDFDTLPFVKDPAGLAVRPASGGLDVGLVDFAHPGGFDVSIDHGYFDRAVWPALRHRFPAADRARLVRTSAGLYDQNRLDGNPVIGNWPGRLDNFYLACGFSGHGLMHAVGTGRALSELIIDGAYTTIDLAALGYERVLAGRPYAETGVR